MSSRPLGDKSRASPASPWLTSDEVIALICACTGLAAIACSTALNVTFYSSLARTFFEAVLLGTMAGIVDVGKGALPIVIVIARPYTTVLRRSFGWLAFCVFTFASFVATLGFFAGNRAATMGEHLTRAAAFSILTEERDQLRSRQREIGEVRSLEEIDAAIARVTCLRLFGPLVC